MIIVDKDLKKLLRERNLIVHSLEADMPFDEEKQIGAGSIDLRLNNKIRRYKSDADVIDLSLSGDTVLAELNPNEGLVIKPGEIILATSLEIVILPPNIAGLITGRSSIARLGLMVQCSQDYMQPGHSQLVPLQLVNVTNRPIRVEPFMRICQIALFYTTSTATVPYGSNANAKYRGEILSPEPSKIGVELGSDKIADFYDTSKDLSDADQKFKKEIHKWRTVVAMPQTSDIVLSKLSDILVAIYIILGASISIMMEELSVLPFPSVKFLVSFSFLLFSISMIIIAKWKK